MQFNWSDLLPELKHVVRAAMPYVDARALAMTCNDEVVEDRLVENPKQKLVWSIFESGSWAQAAGFLGTTNRSDLLPVLDIATANDNHEVLAWAMRKRNVSPYVVMAQGIRLGAISVVREAYHHTYHMPAGALAIAIQHGTLEMVDFVNSFDGDYSALGVVHAAAVRAFVTGDLSMLDWCWAHEYRTTKFRLFVMGASVVKNLPAVMNWLLANGCRLGHSFFNAMGESPECIIPRAAEFSAASQTELFRIGLRGGGTAYLDILVAHGFRLAPDARDAIITRYGQGRLPLSSRQWLETHEGTSFS